MLRTILAGALASGALLAGGGAHAQAYGYGGYGYAPGVGADVGVGLGAPAYAGGGYGYEPYRPHGFTLAGVRAGVTVLGVDVDGSAKLTVGAHDWGHGGYAPAQAPSYASAPQAYAPPVEPPPGYWMGYSAPVNCGCAPPPPPPSCCGY